MAERYSLTMANVGELMVSSTPSSSQMALMKVVLPAPISALNAKTVFWSIAAINSCAASGRASGVAIVSFIFENCGLIIFLLKRAVSLAVYLYSFYFVGDDVAETGTLVPNMADPSRSMLEPSAIAIG